MRDKTTLILPVLMIAVGCGWLLTVLGVAPEVDWIWTLVLAILGLMTFVLGGFDKVTLVIGIFLLAASGLSLLRQSGQLPLNIEVPVLVDPGRRADPAGPSAGDTRAQMDYSRSSFARVVATGLRAFFM